MTRKEVRQLVRNLLTFFYDATPEVLRTIGEVFESESNRLLDGLLGTVQEKYVSNEQRCRL